jgi:hypothetical protein
MNWLCYDEALSRRGPTLHTRSSWCVPHLEMPGTLRNVVCHLVALMDCALSRLLHTLQGLHGEGGGGLVAACPVQSFAHSHTLAACYASSATCPIDTDNKGASETNMPHRHRQQASK